LLLGVLLNYLVPEKVFVWVTSIATFGAIWTWVMILLAQLKFRKGLSASERAGLKYRMWLYRSARTWRWRSWCWWSV
jgi:AAT family amino acid transporter